MLRGGQGPRPVKGRDALRAEMRQLWDGEIVTSAPSATVAARLGPDVLRFIEEVGLPREAPAFDLDLLSPEVWKVVALGGANRDAGLGEFLVLCQRGDDIALGVDLATGRVFKTDLCGEVPPAFVNSSLPLYVESLAKAEAWRRSRPDAPGLLDGDRLAWAELEALDPDIAAHENSIWPAYFYDLEHYY